MPHSVATKWPQMLNKSCSKCHAPSFPLSPSLSLSLFVLSSKSNAKNNAIKIFREISLLLRTHVSRQRNFYCSPNHPPKRGRRRKDLWSLCPVPRSALLPFFLFFFLFLFLSISVFPQRAIGSLFRLLNLMGLPDFWLPCQSCSLQGDSRLVKCLCRDLGQPVNKPSETGPS